MTDKPPLLLVMSPELTRGMIRETSLERLHGIATPLQLEPLARLDDPAHDALLRDCEVFLTGWGCPPPTWAGMISENSISRERSWSCWIQTSPRITD